VTVPTTRSSVHRTLVCLAVGGVLAGGRVLGSQEPPTPPQATAEPVAARIARVESGLLPPILLRGTEPERMSLAERMAHYGAKGLSVAVIDEFELAWARGYGVVRAGSKEPVTPETLFQAGSISKPVAALVALRLVAAGRLALDDPVNDHLAAWKLPDSAAAGSEPVRVRHLLTHSAGLAPFAFPAVPLQDPRPSLAELLGGRDTPGVTRIEPPGRRFRYSNPAFGVLQQLLTDVDGRPFARLAREEVFDPLGMASSSFEAVLPAAMLAQASHGHDGEGEPLPGKGLVVPAAVGGLWTTPTDLCRFLLAVFEASRTDGGFLPRTLAAGMVTRQLENRGLGTEIFAEGAARRTSHGGGLPGFVAFMVGYPELGRGAVVMVNSPGWDLMHEVLRAVAWEYAWPGYVVEHEVVPMAAGDFARFVGRYEFEVRPEVQPEITTASGRFFYGRWEMLPVSDRMFVIPDLGDEIEFVLGDGERATAFLYGQAGTRKIRARRVD